MEQWEIALVCLAICVGAVLIVSGIKWLAKKNAERKGKTLDMNKAEYPLAVASMILAYGGVVAFLYFGVMYDIYSALKFAVPFAASVQTIYVFIVQLVRKGFKGAFASIVNLINKIKASKNPVSELPGIVNDAVSEEQTPEEASSEETSSEEIGKQLYDAIFKDEK